VVGYAAAAEHFVNHIASGPGAWDHFPSQVQQVFIENAPTFLDEAHDPDAFAFDAASLKGFSQPMLLTTGDHSPPVLPPVVAKLDSILPTVETAAFSDAGHIPHETHSEAYAEAIKSFIHKNSQ
jgi:pimeloyl-ACP methyl ester carboxylesterase